MESHDAKQNVKLKNERLMRGWSQKKVSMSIGTSKEMVSRWETGGRTPGMYYQTKLCELFEKTAEELGFLSLLQKNECIRSESENDGIDILMPNDDFQELNPPLTIAVRKCIIETVKDQMEDQGMNKSRRKLLQNGIAATSMVIAPYQESIDTDVLTRLSRALRGNTQGLDHTTLTHLEGVIRNKLRRVANSEGTEWHDILYDVYGYLDLITQHLERSQPYSTYAILCNLASESSYLIGNIFYNEGQYHTANRYYNEALEAARQAKNEVLCAVILTGKGLISIYRDDPSQAKGLPFLEEAKKLITDTNTHDMLRMWICAVHSEIYARAHNFPGYSKAMEEAQLYLARNRPGNTPITFESEINHAHMSASKLLGFEGIGLIQFQKTKESQDVLMKQLHLMELAPNASHLRDRSFTLVDLSVTYLQQAEIKDACVCISKALDCIKQTGLGSSFQRVLAVRQDMKPWGRTPYVKSLDEQIANVLPSLQRINI